MIEEDAAGVREVGKWIMLAHHLHNFHISFQCAISRA